MGRKKKKMENEILDFKKGDLLRFRSKDAIVGFMMMLEKEGYKTDFRYEKDGKKGLWLEIIKGKEMNEIVYEKLKVRNVPSYAENDDLWIVRKDPHENVYWFYGSFNTLEKASECRKTIGNDAFIVIPDVCEKV